jgi:esterase/lipase
VTRIACIHGLGGTGATMARLADRLHRADHEVTTPTLPGHGSQPEALLGVAWPDWLAAVPDADVLVGQSMGGSLALAAAARSASIRAVVCINALAPDPDAVDGLEWRRDRGTAWIDDVPTVGGEVA